MKYAVVFFVASAAWSQSAVEVVQDLIRRGEFTSAAATSEAAVRRSPADYRIWTLRGIALQALGQQKESLAAFRHALKHRPDFLPALQGAAQIEYKTGDARARKTLQSILKLDPEASVAHAMLGVLSFERRDCAAAVQHFRQAGDGLGNLVARWQYATCLFETGAFQQAEAQFEILLRHKDDPQIRYNLALAQVQGGKPSAAIQTLQQASDPDSLSLLASAHESLQQTPAASDVLRRGVGMHPRQERLYLDLASLCLDHKALDLGLDVVATGRRNIPGSSRLAAMEGVLQVRAGRMEAAEAAFREAGRLAPDPSLGRVGLAVTMMQMGLPEDAARLLRELLATGSADPRVETTLVRTLIQKGPTASELAEATRRIQKVVRQAPDDAASHALLGKLLLDQNQPDLAAVSLETSIRLDPSDRAATYQLMTIYRRQGRLKEAEALQRRVRALLARERQSEEQAGRYRLIRAPDQR